MVIDRKYKSFIITLTNAENDDDADQHDSNVISFSFYDVDFTTTPSRFLVGEVLRLQTDWPG